MDIVSYLLGKQSGGSTPTGEVEITQNGVHNVSGYATANVQVPQPTGTINITTNGTHDVTNYASANVSVESAKIESKDVDFIDYDGTIVYSYTKAEFLALTEMPANPSHTGLTSQGWNWTLQDAKTYVTNYGQHVIGQMYVTDDGKTRLYVELLENALEPTVGLGVNGSVTIDWGDGNTSTVTGSSLDTRVDTSHAYSSAGKYIIKVYTNNVSTTYKILVGNSTGSALIWDGVASGSNSNSMYHSALKKIEIGNNVSIGTTSFNYLTNLETITIPYEITSLPMNVFDYCYGIKCLIIPSQVTDKFGMVAPYSLQHISFSAGTIGTGIGTPNTLKKICVPPSSTSAPSCNTFSVLESITIPSGVTSINKNGFSSCYSLRKINLPNTITSIGQSAFSNCNSVAIYDFSNFNSIPSLATNVFYNNASKMKIIVPDALYNDWIVTDNWSSWASYIVKASEA